jgi:hypothetical protein
MHSAGLRRSSLSHAIRLAHGSADLQFYGFTARFRKDRWHAAPIVIVGSADKVGYSSLNLLRSLWSILTRARTLAVREV